MTTLGTVVNVSGLCPVVIAKTVDRDDDPCRLKSEVQTVSFGRQIYDSVAYNCDQYCLACYAISDHTQTTCYSVLFALLQKLACLPAIVRVLLSSTNYTFFSFVAHITTGGLL